MLITPDDIWVSPDIKSDVLSALSNKRQYGRLETTNQTRFVVNRSNSLDSLDDLTNSIRLMTAMHKHAEYIAENAKRIFLPHFNAVNRHTVPDIRLSHNGLVSVWDYRDLQESLTVPVGLVEASLEPAFDRVHTNEWALKSGFSSPDSSLPILQQAVIKARALTIKEKIPYGSRIQVNTVIRDGQQHVGLDSWLVLRKVASAVTEKLPASLIWDMRAKLLADLRNDTANADALRRNASQQAFVKYWSQIKDRALARVDSDTVLAEFAEIPLLPAGTLSSRTWGIEIETVAADRTSRPRGWDERHDGSLESMTGGDCECGCEDCDDGSHCEYDDCFGGDNGSTREFVSPILNHYNSAGLRQLCGDLEDTPTNTSPGIHVHVGAHDLTIEDVARLVRAYSAVSPFLWPVMRRQVKGYCKDVTAQNLAFWLASSRDVVRKNLQAQPVDVVRDQPDDRYHDLNLQALRAHGTVEFRAMGPYYNYDTLVRWAWFVRELVNVSKVAVPESVWTSITSMRDVVRVLSEYGSEIPEQFMSSETLAVLDIEEAEEYATSNY